MTEQEAKNKIVSWAKSQIGYREGDSNWNKYAVGKTGAYGWDVQNQPWCDVFVDVGFVDCFGAENASKMTYQPKGGFSALCSASANYYKANGAWFSTPSVGDQVFFNYSGGINHTGIVVEVTGGIVSCIEGNSSDMVRQNNYRVNDPCIAGFGRPNWSVVSTQNAQTPVSAPTTAPQEPVKVVKYCTVTMKLPVIEYGDASVYVKIMQNLLIAKGYNCGWYGADGEYGQQTKIALFQFQQKYASECGLSDGKPDCVCGQATWTKLLEVK